MKHYNSYSKITFARNHVTILLILRFQVIFWFYVVKWVPVKYGEVEYPMYAHIIGAFMSLASMLWIPGYALYYIATQRGSLRDVSKH